MTQNKEKIILKMSESSFFCYGIAELFGTISEIFVREFIRVIQRFTRPEIQKKGQSIANWN